MEHSLEHIKHSARFLLIILYQGLMVLGQIDFAQVLNSHFLIYKTGINNRNLHI